MHRTYRFPVPVRLAVKSNLIAWCNQSYLTCFKCINIILSNVWYFCYSGHNSTQPTKNSKILTQPDPTQPNPWVNPTHGQLWCKHNRKVSCCCGGIAQHMIISCKFCMRAAISCCYHISLCLVTCCNAVCYHRHPLCTLCILSFVLAYLLLFLLFLLTNSMLDCTYTASAFAVFMSQMMTVLVLW